MKFGWLRSIALLWIITGMIILCYGGGWSFWIRAFGGLYMFGALVVLMLVRLAEGSR